MDVLLLDGVLARAVAQVWRTRGNRERRYVLYVDWAHVDRLSSELCVDWATLLLVSATLNRCKLEGMHGGEPGGEPTMAPSGPRER